MKSATRRVPATSWARRTRQPSPTPRAGLREAVDLAPTSHAVVAALVAALEARGRWDEAAELATEAMALPRGDRVWADFLITWAEPVEPSLDWLRNLVST